MRIKYIVVASAVVAATFTGCSSDSNSSSESTTTAAAKTTTTAKSDKEPVCAARDALDKSVTGLTDPSLLTSGKSAIQGQIDTVKSDLDSLSSAAKDVYKPQVDDVKSALDDVRTAVSNLGGGNIAENLQAVGSAIAKVGTSVATLDSTLRTACS